MKNWLSTDPEIGKAKLGFFQFNQTEWETLERICLLLQKFESATTMMSGETYPTLSFVMPVFIELFSFIDHQIAISSNVDPMKEALGAAH
jgi:hypothetical protein